MPLVNETTLNMTVKITRNILLGSNLPGDNRVNSVKVDHDTARLIIQSFKDNGGTLIGEIGQPRPRPFNNTNYIIRASFIDHWNAGVILETPEITVVGGRPCLIVTGTLTETAAKMFPDTSAIKLGARMLLSGPKLVRFVTFDLIANNVSQSPE